MAECGSLFQFGYRPSVLMQPRNLHVGTRVRKSPFRDHPCPLESGSKKTMGFKFNASEPITMISDQISYVDDDR